MRKGCPVEFKNLSPEAAAVVEFMKGQTSRRRILQAAGLTGVAAVAAACGAGGADDAGSASASTGGATSAAPSASTATDKSDTEKVANWSNWPLYIDENSLKEFEAQTGIKVTYTEDVNDNNEFFAKVRTQLEQGQDIGRDLVVLTDWMASFWINNGYAQKLDKANIPNAKNLLPKFQGVAFDPNRDYTLPWQSGFGAFGWNKTKVKELLGIDQLTTLEQLLDPKINGKVSVLTEFRDTMGIFIAAQGNDPSNFTDDQWNSALDLLTQNVDNGQIRQVKGNDYVTAMESGDVVAVIGWSGDMFQLGAKYGVGLPATGGTLWTDNFLIPALAAHKKNGEAVMNYYYDPKVAAEVAAYVQYISPVAGAKEEMAKIDPKLVDNQWIFPSEETLSNAYVFMQLDAEKTLKYERDFQKAIGN